MKKSELKNIILEEIKTLLNERSMYNDDLIRLHKAKDQKEYDSIMTDLRKSSGWSLSDAEYMLKKYRKDMGYKGSKFYVEEPKKPAVVTKKVIWNDRMYQKWIKDMASGGGAKHSYDMAQNAKHEPGLLDFVKRNKTWGNESPLERIQWDIEVYT